MDWVSFAAGCGFTVCACAAVFTIASAISCRSLNHWYSQGDCEPETTGQAIEMNERSIPKRSYGRFDDFDF